MTARRVTLCALGAMLALAACTNAIPGLLPPPFGPDPLNPQAARLIFPTGLAVTPEGFVLVANGNFNHAFSAGTVVSIDAAFVAGLFDAASPPLDVALDDPTATQPHIVGSALIGNYSGPLTLDQTGHTAYTGSRDTSRLNAVSIDAAGGVFCPGTTDQRDCRQGVIDLGAQISLEGPYGIAAGFVRTPGATQDQNAIFVSALVPHIDTLSSGVLLTSAPVAALDASNPSSVLFSVQISNATVASGSGVGPLIFDAGRRQLIMGGCYQRYPSSGQGEPATAKCPTGAGNALRFVSVDAGSAAQVRLVDVSSNVNGSDTSGLALGNFDACTASPGCARAHTLYATLRLPDVLAEIDLPDDPAMHPTIRRATPLPVSPAQILLIAQPPGAPPASDLIAVAGSANGSVSIFDAGSGQVVAQIEHLGDTPFALAQLPPKAGDTAARVLATVFNDCRVALLDINYQHPWESRLRTRLGSCP